MFLWTSDFKNPLVHTDFNIFCERVKKAAINSGIGKIWIFAYKMLQEHFLFMRCLATLFCYQPSCAVPSLIDGLWRNLNPVVSIRLPNLYSLGPVPF